MRAVSIRKMHNQLTIMAIILWCVATSAFQSQPNLMQPLQRTPTNRATSLIVRSMSDGVQKKKTSYKPPGTDSDKRQPTFFLTHERDFYRQMARIESLDAYVLVSTLTASMSFGALLGFTPTRTTGLLHAGSAILYRTTCSAIQVAAGFSTIFGLYATIIFSLTILYGKSALGTERDPEFDLFMRKTGSVRLHGFRCFSLSLGFFALEAVLVLLEKISYFPVVFAIPVGCTAVTTMYYLYKDWKVLFKSARILYPRE